ncbi:hypothetical protein scyTo_0020220, partial [Scyliorhinus torazame]|nr:hypothetical protein [Scyliorhinus torazame]
APSVSFTRLGNSNKLSCVATGFYPQSIEVTMHRDEKDGEMYSSGVRPNHDGTYQMEKRTEYDTESAKYSCKVDHSGLTEPMILFYEPKADSMVPVIVGVVIAVLVLIALAIVGVVIYRKKGRKWAVRLDKGTVDAANVGGIGELGRVIGVRYSNYGVTLATGKC